MKTLKHWGRKVLQAFVFTWIGLVWLFSVSLVAIDRLVMALAVWRDMPSLREIDEYEHLKDQVTQRVVVYAVLVGLFFMCRWAFYLIF